MNESSPTFVLYQIIKALGFQDLTSFVLALIFVITVCAFIITGAIFLLKKRRERREALLNIVHDVQKTGLEEKTEQIKPHTGALVESKPKDKISPETKSRETSLKIKPKPEAKREIRPASLPAEPRREDKPEKEIIKERLEEQPVPKVPDTREALGAALKNTRGGFIEKISRLFSRGHEINDADFEAMEAILFTADIGAKTAQKLLDNLKARVKEQKISDQIQVRTALKDEMRAILLSAQVREQPMSVAPKVFMFVGVNGAGKTTSIAKLGAKLAGEGKSVIFGAGDTFRAAAVQQLSIWGERVGIPVVSGKEGADSASVLFEAIAQGKRDRADAVLCDTAGRLHTKIELMEELKKVCRVVNKAHEGAPHEVFLVVDATMGQNAIQQAREFAQATPLTGVVLSKLDGTAKGGVALGIVDELKVPIRYIGIGEQASDLKEFDADQFVDALFEEN